MRPACQEIGETLQRSVRVALSPLRGLVWGFEEIEEFVSTKVAEKLKGIPPEEIVNPALNVAGPALEALKYTGYEPLLRDLYANLLAAAMNKNMKNGAHPAFVDIIKQLTSDEAKLIKFFTNSRSFPLITVRWEYKATTTDRRGGLEVLVNFSFFGNEAGLEYPDQTAAYIDNLSRLGLVEVPSTGEYTTPGVYEPLENAPQVQKVKMEIERNQELRCVIQRKCILIKEFGKQFMNVCVVCDDSETVR